MTRRYFSYMSTLITVPFSPFEQSIRWARNTVRAHAVLMRLVHAEAVLPPVELLVGAAREVLDGGTADAEDCHEQTELGWAFVETFWDSLTDDPFGVRYALF